MAIRIRSKSEMPTESEVGVSDSNNSVRLIPKRKAPFCPDDHGMSEIGTIEPEVGDHLVTPRTGYTHHGIYIGNSEVIHYSGLADGLQSGPIEKTTLNIFSSGRGYTVKKYLNPKFQGQAVVDRAISRLGEDLYHLYSNNCEHFCEWCINDQHRSEQVDNAKTVTMQSVAGYVAMRLITPPPVAAAITIGHGIYYLMQKSKSVGNPPIFNRSQK